MRDLAPYESVLAVDLDGTLLKSDMLWECFWASAAQNPFHTARAAWALRKGRPALKAELADAARPDIARLPYDEEVIAYIRNFREQGGKVALVTASDQGLAEAVAHHLQIFDEVHGTEEGRNLKGEAKAAFLIEQYGEGNFTYMGDARADVPVWRAAGKAVTVDADASLRREAEAQAEAHEHLGQEGPALKPILKALRLHQWFKNILIFVPMVSGHAITGTNIFLSLLAFLSFGLVASSGYILNDLMDLANDRAHERKRNRPLASGALSINRGSWLWAALLLLGLGIALTVGLAFAAVIAFYFVMTLTYSLKLKRHMMLDICVLAGLYTLRIFAGGVALGIELSIWLLAFSLFFFLSLAAVKRQAELVHLSSRGKSGVAGRGYEVEDLPLITQMAVSSGYISILVLALFLNDPAIQAQYERPWMLWLGCGVLIYWLSRIFLITHRGEMHDDPVVYAATDWKSQVCLGVIAVLVVGAAI